MVHKSTHTHERGPNGGRKYDEEQILIETRSSYLSLCVCLRVCICVCVCVCVSITIILIVWSPVEQIHLDLNIKLLYLLNKKSKSKSHTPLNPSPLIGRLSSASLGALKRRQRSRIWISTVRIEWQILSNYDNELLCMLQWEGSIEVEASNWPMGTIELNKAMDKTYICTHTHTHIMMCTDVLTGQWIYHDSYISFPPPRGLYIPPFLISRFSFLFSPPAAGKSWLVSRGVKESDRGPDTDTETKVEGKGQKWRGRAPAWVWIIEIRYNNPPRSACVSLEERCRLLR